MKTTHLPTIPFEVHPTSVSGISLLVLPHPDHHTPQLSIQMQTDLAKRLAHAANVLPELMSAAGELTMALARHNKPEKREREVQAAWELTVAALMAAEEVKDA